MDTLRARWLPWALVAAVSLLPLRASVPEYRLGDVVVEDVVTPVPLVIVDPDATDALKQKLAQEVLFVVRHSPQTTVAAEVRLRAAVADTRARFLEQLQAALSGRAPAESDLGSPEQVAVVKKVAETAPRQFPFANFVPVWIRGQSDETLTAALIQPVRDVMAQPVVGSKTESPLPTNQPVRLLAVRSLEDAPTPRELEGPVQRISAGQILSLWRARRLVETSFPAAQDAMGRFAASFVQANAVPDAELTDVLRARRMEGVTANETFAAAQVVVRKGQRVDRKALAALAALREKSMIGALQSKLAQEQTVASQLSRQTVWIAVGLGVICVTLLLILWRLRSRPGGALVLTSGGLHQALPAGDRMSLTEAPGTDAWRQRALLAEGKAERAQDAIRSGVLGWMKEKLYQTLFRHRAELLSAQQRAQAEMSELERRLEHLHTPLQERISAYEKRIAELEQELAAKGEENRELIGARIAVTRQQLHVERERSRYGEN